MSSSLPADLVFREAALLSELVSESQWRAAATEVKQARQAAGAAPILSDEDRKQVCDEISTILIRDGVVTSYQVTQLRAGRTKLTLGPYVVTEFLGKGGMGQVFGGVHKIMGRRCAIKVLPLDKSDNLARESFQREIRLQASLDCPYLVRAFDAGREGSVHFLVTEYVPGTDLRRLVKEGGRLSVQQAASIIAQAAAGLAYAHESGFIHRDVKPANILVTPDGHAKVADVGLAALIGTPDDDPRFGKVVGTADYLAPEQIRTPHEVGPQCDVYSLGCTMYYAITGKVPFPGGDSRSKCKRHLTQSPWDPRRFAPELSDSFVEIIADMMEKDVDKRIQSASEVVRRLSPWASIQSDEGESWLAERGIEFSDESAHPATPIATHVGIHSVADDLSWKTSAGETGGTGTSNSDLLLEELPASSEAISSITGDPPPPLPDHNGDLTNHLTGLAGHPVPPPLTASERSFVSLRTLWFTVAVAVLLSGVAGFALGMFLKL